MMWGKSVVGKKVQIVGSGRREEVHWGWLKHQPKIEGGEKKKWKKNCWSQLRGERC